MFIRGFIFRQIIRLIIVAILLPFQQVERAIA